MPGFSSTLTRLMHPRTIRSAWHLVAAGSAVALTGAVVMAASPAMAFGAPVYWVSSAATTAKTDVSCQTAAYSTVQSAVTAAEAFEAQHPGLVPTVNICPGTYSEQLSIANSVVLTRAPVPAGLGPVTIQLPAAVGSNQKLGLSTTTCQAADAAENVTAPQSVIEVCATSSDVQVSVNDLTVAGDWPTSVCYDSLYGILVGGGATLSLTDSVVERIGAYPLNGCQGGVGVQVGFAPTSQVGHATLRDDTIETYQKNGITVDGPGSTADIDHIVVTGAGATSAIAQNGIQISFGATGSVTNSTITGNNYTGTGEASSTGILVVGGGGTTCGIGADSPLVHDAVINSNQLTGNDIGVALYNTDPTCTKSPSVPTRDTVCGNAIENANGYPSADANISGFSATVGYQAGIEDIGNHDIICENQISGAGYAPRDATSSLPNPPPPAFTRPIDLVSVPAIAPEVFENTYDGEPYNGG
jgi:hypothetical protein